MNLEMKKAFLPTRKITAKDESTASCYHLILSESHDPDLICCKNSILR